MESLSDTEWDVVISGTGLSQSLLALALSRTGKKVLHIDKNDYYGGAEAALSLQEAKAWAEAADEDAGSSPFSHVTIKNLEEEARDLCKDESSAKLGFSRAYSLSLSPQLIYTRSNLLPALVSSKVYRQLEFLAVGNWWIYSNHEAEEEGHIGSPGPSKRSLRRIPGGREDVFADKGIDLRSTRSLMKLLKLAADPEAHESILERWGSKPFTEFLEGQLSIPQRLQAPLLALTLSPNPPADTLTSYALPRIHRHLTSIGMFGPGFGSVIPKWGGLAEIAQVACRAGAVGGGVYVLKRGFARHGNTDQEISGRGSISLDQHTSLCTVRLEDGEDVKSHWIVGSLWDLPSPGHSPTNDQIHSSYMARSITIVSGSLSQLFPLPAEGAPPPAGAVVFFPSGMLEFESGDQVPPRAKTESPPVYLMVHSSDTGECPAGQCVVYAYAIHKEHVDVHRLLQSAVKRLVDVPKEESPATALWYMHYDQKHEPPATTDGHDANIKCEDSPNNHILRLPDLAPGLALDEDVLKHVQAAYDRIVGNEGAAFMVFEDREGTGDDDNEN